MKTSPISIRLRPVTKQRLDKFLEATPMMSAGDVIDFSLSLLFASFDAGDELRITDKGLSLAPAKEEYEARALEEKARKKR